MNYEKAEHFLLQLSETDNKLPVSPKILGDLFQQTSSESLVSLEEASWTISKDQGLTARILTRANSAYYGLQGKISSISRAINLLGLSELRKILLFVTMSSISDRIRPDIFDLKKYWGHQCFVAAMASELASRCKISNSQDMFVSGILHDMGKLMTALYQPQAWKQILELSAEKKLDHFEAEQEFWGIDHAVAGAMVLRRWNLPENITEAINAHHNTESADETYIEQARILNLANTISHNLDNDSFPEQPEPFERLGLDIDDTLGAAADIAADPSFADLRRLFVH